MYNDFFAIESPPFRITPDTNLFFSGAKRGAVLDALVYSVLNGEGIIKVVGEVGSGKTMLCRMLEIRLPEHVEIVYIANPSLSPENILQVIAFELKVIVDAEVSKLEAMQKLQSLLMQRHEQGRQVVVFIEEAQSMPSATLEEVRLLSNLETGQSKLMQVVLFGQPELDENLGHKSIRQLRERITYGFHLEPLDAGEVCEYLNFRMWVSGYRGEDIFDKSIAGRIADYSHGMIRRINILADKTLLAAFVDDTRILRRRHVLAAARDSQFVVKRGRLASWAFVSTVALAASIVTAVAILAFVRWGDVQLPASRVSISRADDAVEIQGFEPVPDGRTTASESAADNPNSQSPARDTTGVEIKSQSRQDAPTGQSRTGPAGDEPVEPEDAAPSVDLHTTGPTLSRQPGQATAAMPGIDMAGEPAAAVKKHRNQVGYDQRLKSRLQLTRDWMARSNTPGYSIQLLTVNRESANKLSEYLEKLPSSIDLDKVYVYETSVEGSIKLAVLYNWYTDLDNAWSAVESLPARLQRWQPFVRTVLGVKTDITE